MMIKVAVSDCFKLKMIPSFRSVFFPEKQEIHYIGGTDILPLPLSSEEEGHAISLLGGVQDEEGKKLLKQWNLPENLRGVGAVALGYLEGEEPKAAPRKEGYIVEVR